MNESINTSTCERIQHRAIHCVEANYNVDKISATRRNNLH